MASYLTAGFSVRCIACRFCDIKSIQQVEYLPLVSVVHVSQFSNFMERYLPLYAFVHIFECFLRRTSISVQHWWNIFPRALVSYNAAISGKISRFLKGEGEIVNMDFQSSLYTCIAASCNWVQPYQTWYLLQGYCSVTLIIL